MNDRKRAAQPAFRPAPKEPVKISPLEAALEEFERRATYLSDSEENDDGDEDDHDNALDRRAAAIPKQPANAAPKSAVKTTTKAPTSTLQRKFGGFKPSVSPAAVVTKKAPVAKQAESSQKRSQLVLPQTRNSEPLDEKSSPQSLDELMTAVESQQQAPAVSAPPRKRKAVDIFMRPKRRA